MKVLVTGGAGFVGLNLIKELVSGGTTAVTVVDNFEHSSIDEFWRRIESFGQIDVTKSKKEGTISRGSASTQINIERADIRDCSLAMKACANKDAVVHLAAETGIPMSQERPRENLDVNVQGTFNYLDACRVNNVGQFVNASSAAVIGGGTDSGMKIDGFGPLSPYGASKASGEAYCSAYFFSYGLKTISLRFANLYGEYSWRKGSVVAKFCKNILRGDPIVLDGSGTQTRDFVYVKDVALIISDLIGNRVDISAIPNGGVLDIATGHQTSIVSLAGKLKHLFVGKVDGIVIEDGPARIGDVSSSCPDPTLLNALLPNRKMRLLEENLGRVVDWFVSVN
jgi:UDP-glucose 4-epimerase